MCTAWVGWSWGLKFDITLASVHGNLITQVHYYAYGVFLRTWNDGYNVDSRRRRRDPPRTFADRELPRYFCQSYERMPRAEIRTLINVPHIANSRGPMLREYALSNRSCFRCHDRREKFPETLRNKRTLCAFARCRVRWSFSTRERHGTEFIRRNMPLTKIAVRVRRIL